MLKLPKISLGRSYSPLIGLDITTSSIKLIELTKSGDGYRVESYAAEPSPPNSINEKAIVDAQSYFTGRVADLEGVCHEPEFGFWPRS